MHQNKDNPDHKMLEELRAEVGAVLGKRCPVCQQEYAPTHSSKEEAVASRDLCSAEQWISGICSQKCWDDLFPEEA